MDGEDPITQFFPGEDSVDLYAVLSLKSDAKLEDIKRSYRRHALIYHPDKHTSSSDVAKADASTKFQQIGFAYAVLSDEKRKARYDRTGRTDEGFEMAGEDGWEAYFEDMFERVTRGKLDEMKKEYQGKYHLPLSEAYINVIVGSAEEADDIKNAYMETAGSIGDIMTYIPHSTHDDEAQFIILITDLIAKGELVSLPGWESSKKDETSRLVRQKQGKKEAKEAEKLAKELGVWDEFYGTGKTGARKDKGKGKKDESAGAEEEDHSALQALILKKKKNMDGFFDNLASKYAEPESKAKGKGKKRGKGGEVESEEGESSQKKSRRGQAPPEIDDEEFEKLQQKLFGDKAKSSVAPASKGKAGRSKKAK
jgi:DnaJ family protein C protein 9